MTMDNYTAVVFVHGIGRHVRGDNLGELLTELEKISHYDAEEDGVLREFEANVELANVGSHVRYLKNREVSETIYNIIVRGLSGVTPDLPGPAALRMRKASKYCLIASLLFFVFTWLSLFLYSALPYWILPYLPYPWAILSACVAMAWFWDWRGD